MSRTWLLIMVGGLVGLVPQPSLAQAAASATVRARVKPAPEPPTPPNSPVALPPVVPGAGREALEIFTLDVAGSPLMRLFVCPSDTRTADESRAACLWRVGEDASGQRSQPPPEPQQITVRWADFPQWPAFLAISGAARAGRVPPGHYVAYLTIIAEY
jgi:hypothetical protein